MSGPGFLFDTSVWLALAFTTHPLHGPAEAAFVAASPARPAVLCRATQQSVLRLLTTASMARQFGVPPATNREALSLLDNWSGSASVAYREEPPSVFPRWRTLADLTSASPKRWMDAYLAAFAIEAGLDFVTGDGAFATFPGLNPTVLVPPKPAGQQPAGQGGGSPP